MSGYDLVKMIVELVVEYAMALPETDAGRELRERVRQTLAEGAIELGGLRAQQAKEHDEVNGGGRANGD